MPEIWGRHKEVGISGTVVDNHTTEVDDWSIYLPLGNSVMEVAAILNNTQVFKSTHSMNKILRWSVIVLFILLAASLVFGSLVPLASAHS